MRRTLQTLAVVVALLGAACGDIVDGTGETGYKTIDVSGGEVKARDTVVSVPEGALAERVTVTIAPAPAEELPEGSAGRAVDVGAGDAELAAPMTVRIRFDDAVLPDATRRDLVWIGEVVDGEWEPLLDPIVDEVERTASGTTRRGGRFGVVYGCGRGRRCPVELAFSTLPQRVMAGECSGEVVLRSADASGRGSPVQHDTTVALSADEGSVLFYKDAGCAREAITSVTIPVRQMTTSFYFRGRAARSVTLTAQARDLRPATQDQTIYPGSGVSFGFVTQPQRVLNGACSQAITLAFEDAFGNRAPVPNDARMIPSATAAATINFYSDDQCATGTGGITIPAGTASGTFYFKGQLSNLRSETITLTASVGAFGQGFTASQSHTLVSPPPVAVRFYSLPQTVTAGACSGTVLVGPVDSGGNRTEAEANTDIDVTAPAGMSLYADAACTALLGRGVTVPAGSTSAGFYFRAPNVGSYTLTASASGLASDTQTQTVR